MLQPYVDRGGANVMNYRLGDFLADSGWNVKIAVLFAGDSPPPDRNGNANGSFAGRSAPLKSCYFRCASPKLPRITT